METKLSTNGNFSFADVADIMALRDAVADLQRQAKGNGKQSSPRGSRRHRSRSRSREGNGHSHGRYDRNKGGNDRGKGSKDGGKGARSDSRSKGGGRGSNNWQRRNAEVNEPQKKPELWAATEANDEQEVERLLTTEDPNDTSQKYQGWTPLMKAAQEGHLAIMHLLLYNSANLEATNRKGRTALSFAAAPSMNNTEKRSTPVEAIRLLLEFNADPNHKDNEGRTPEQKAAKENRQDAIQIFNDWRLNAPPNSIFDAPARR